MQGMSGNWLPVESKTRTYYRRVGTERTAEWPGGVRQDWVPTELFAQETRVPGTLYSIEDTSSCLPRCTKKAKERSAVFIEEATLVVSWPGLACD